MTANIDFSLFTPFSNPFENENSSIFSVIANASTKNIVRSFYEKHVLKKVAVSSVIKHIFLDFEKKNLPISVCWDPVMGKVEKYLQEEGTDFNNHLVDLMCYLSIKGIFSDWELELDLKGDLFFGNYTMKNCSFSSIAHDSFKKRLSFKNELGIFYLLYNKTKQKKINFLKEAQLINEQYSPAYMHLHDSRTDIVQYLSDFVDLPKPLKYKSHVNEALLILQNHTPQYLTWVLTITKQVIIYNSPSPNQIKSGSWYDLPGIYNFSVNHEPLLIAEMLVHESSHQYFNLLKRFADVANSSEPIYFSPAVKKMRPLWLILFAYHAFANVLIFYRILAKQKTINPLQVKIRTSEIEPLVNSLEEHLVNSKIINGLTPIGYSIFEPLYKKLRSI